MSLLTLLHLPIVELTKSSYFLSMMATNDTLPLWAYRQNSLDVGLTMGREDDETPLKQQLEMLELTETEVKCPFVVCLFSHIVSDKQSSVRIDSGGEESTVTVNFQQKSILFFESVSSVQPMLRFLSVSKVRYVAFVSRGFLENVDGSVILLSLYEQNLDIYNVYIVAEKESAMLFVNAVNKLIFGLSQNAFRVQQFRPLLNGTVLLSSCSQRQFDADKDVRLSLQSKVVNFILDDESICFFSDRFNSIPLFDFRFYRERLPKSIDIISISKDHSHLELRQQAPSNYGETTVCFILPCSYCKEDFDDLIRMFQTTVRSKPQDIFRDPEEFERFVKKERGLNAQPQSIIRRVKESPSKRKREFDESSESHDLESMSSIAPDDNLFHYQRSPSSVYLQTVPWLNLLYTGQHISDKDESLLNEWYTYEFDIQQFIDSGTVPHSSIDSGGLDGKSTDHLQRAIEEIKDNLLSNRMDIALSHLQGCIRIFGDTLLKPVKELDEMELMKRIFFLSGWG